MRNQKIETEKLTDDRENSRSPQKKQKRYRRMRGFRAAILALFAAAQLTFLTACSVNIPMVSDSADTEGYTDAQTMLVIATDVKL